MRVETETMTDQDIAELSAEGAELRDAGEAQDTGGTEQIVETDDSCSDVAAEGADHIALQPRWRRTRWTRAFAFGLLPVLALAIAGGAAYLKWSDAWVHGSNVAGIESVSAAKDSTAALLSYQADTVEQDLGTARDRLTGAFKDSYTQLVHDVVIPGAKKQHISAVATVPAAASVSATPQHAVVLVFVDQTVTVGNDAPTETASTVRVTLDKSGPRWLISSFDPV